METRRLGFRDLIEFRSFEPDKLNTSPAKDSSTFTTDSSRHAVILVPLSRKLPIKTNSSRNQIKHNCILYKKVLGSFFDTLRYFRATTENVRTAHPSHLPITPNPTLPKVTTKPWPRFDQHVQWPIWAYPIIRVRNCMKSSVIYYEEEVV